jgi:hypothetical protein
MTVAQIDQVTSDMKYRSFLLPDKIEGGKKVTHKIQFDDKMLGSEDMDDEELKDKSYELLDEEGGMESETRIFKVNPELIRNLKYKISVSADDLNPKSKAIEKALLLEGYDRAIQNPVSDQEAVTRDFLFEALVPGQSDKYIKKPEPAPAMGGMPTGGVQGLNRNQNQKGVNTSMLSQMSGSNSLGVAASSEQ